MECLRILIRWRQKYYGESAKYAKENEKCFYLKSGIITTEFRGITLQHQLQ